MALFCCRPGRRATERKKEGEILYELTARIYPGGHCGVRRPGLSRDRAAGTGEILTVSFA